MTPRLLSIEMLTDDACMEWSAEQRLLYLGLFNYAEDSGCFKARLQDILLKILPMLQTSKNELKKWLEQMTAEGYLYHYEVDGEDYYHITKFQEIVVFHKTKPRKPRIPLPDYMTFEPYSTNPHIGKYSILTQNNTSSVRKCTEVVSKTPVSTNADDSTTNTNPVSKELVGVSFRSNININNNINNNENDNINNNYIGKTEDELKALALKARKKLQEGYQQMGIEKAIDVIENGYELYAIELENQDYNKRNYAISKGKEPPKNRNPVESFTRVVESVERFVKQKRGGALDDSYKRVIQSVGH